MKIHIAESNVSAEQPMKARRVVGYVRVSIEMQATDGLSLDAQTAVIEQYCTAHGYKLLRIYRDVLSGAKEQRPGLLEALDTLQWGADILIVLKFDRLSRSINVISAPEEAAAPRWPR